MNEELIMKMAEASVKNGILTYALFDRIYGMLSRREQYQVCEILNKNNIQLEDTYDSNDYSASSTEILEGNNPVIDLEEESGPLFDESIFKDPKGVEEYLFFPDTVKQTNDTLIRLAQEGNRQARQDLCIKNERLVWKYANGYYRYFGNDLDFEDLMQAGFMGLLTAAEKFDFRKKT